MAPDKRFGRFERRAVQEHRAVRRFQIDARHRPVRADRHRKANDAFGACLPRPERIGLVRLNHRQNPGGCTIAETAGVTRATVSATLRSLRTLGYIDYVPYGSIELTPTGLTKAKALRERRLTLERFFTDIFGTDPKIARKLADANKHGAPPKMLKGLSDLTGFIAENREAWEAFRRR